MHPSRRGGTFIWRSESRYCDVPRRDYAINLECANTDLMRGALILRPAVLAHGERTRRYLDPITRREIVGCEDGTTDDQCKGEGAKAAIVHSVS
jgi:hypothetical protein